MIKDIFVIWIIIQLIIIGIAGVSVKNEIVNQTYDCERVILPMWVGICFPLVLFVSNDLGVKEYCKNLEK